MQSIRFEFPSHPYLAFVAVQGQGQLSKAGAQSAWQCGWDSDEEEPISQPLNNSSDDQGEGVGEAVFLPEPLPRVKKMSFSVFWPKDLSSIDLSTCGVM